jgi:hypothetical protein
VLRQGILWLVIAWVVLRGNQTSIAAVGILLILLAFWVSGSDQVYALAQRTFLILFWVGLVALFRGFTQIMLAFGVRHAGNEAAAALCDTGRRTAETSRTTVGPTP